MERTSTPMTPQDRDILHAFLRDQGLRTRLNLLVAGAAILCGLAFLVYARAGQWASSAAVLLVPAAVVAWQIHTIVRRRRDLSVLRQALDDGSVFRSCGRLLGIDTVQPGRLAYRTVQGTLTVHPLVDALDLPATAIDMQVTEAIHAQAGDVVMHWLPLGQVDAVLLRAEYPDTAPACRQTVAFDAAAQQRAAWRGRELLITMAVVFPILALMNLPAYGVSATTVMQTLAIGGVALGTMVGCLKLWQRRLARRRSCMLEVTGPVTEIVRARVGRRPHVQHHTWYRVGGTLLCPGPAVDGPVVIGDTVKVGILPDESAGGRHALMSFSVEQADDTWSHAPGV